MSTLLPRTTEFRVNVRADGTQHQSDVTAVSGGGYAFAWDSQTDFGLTYTDRIVLRVYNAAGVALSDELIQAQQATRRGGVRDPRVTQASDGSFVTVWAWRDENVSFSNQQIRGRALDLNAVATDFTLVDIPGTNPSSLVSTDVTARPGGGFQLAYTRVPVPGQHTDVLSASFTTTGGAVAGPAQVTATTGLIEGSASLARLSDGRHVVVWSAIAAVGSPTSVDYRARFLDASGAPTGAEIALGTGDYVPGEFPGVEVTAVTALANGGFVAAWTQAGGQGLDVRARVYDAAGAPLTAAFIVSATDVGAQSDPSIATLADGSFAIAWTEGASTLGDGSGSAIHLRQFSAAGLPLGSEILVNSATAGDQFDSAMAAGADGTLAVSWTSTDSGDADVRAVLFGTATTIGGTIGDDVLDGTPGPDLIQGFAGNDALRGLGGDDRLEGGPGNDTLDGGDGDDTVDPGPGVDTADGGAGVDTLDYSRAAGWIIADLQVGLSFDGTQETIRNFENVIGSAFNDSLFGSTGPNRLEGRGGVDTLVGGEGDDILLGGDGDDTLDPGPGRDMVDGGAGVDTLSLAGSPVAMIVDLNVGQTFDGTVADTLVSVENAIGSRFNDMIFGSESVANTIDGGPGGADILYGGNDPGDTVSYASSTRGVIIDLGAGLTYDGVDQDRISGFEAAIGSAFDDQIFGTFTQRVDPGAGGRDTIVDAWLVAYDSSPRAVIIDLMAQRTFDGVDQDVLSGVHNARGSRFDDQIFGSDMNNIIDGGPGFDRLHGGGGLDVFVLRRGEADGDTILDFAGNGSAQGDYIELRGYSPGSTFAPLAGNATTWLATDAATGAVDVIRILGAVHPSDWGFVG